MQIIKPKNWKGNDLKGEWQITVKLDGVRALIEGGTALSRNSKPLYNLEHIPDGDYEVYLGSWEESVSAVRTREGSPVELGDLYSLYPIDERLILENSVDSPTADYINGLLEQQVHSGKEGLVLRQGDKWLKVKPTYSYDVKLEDVVEGKGRNVGRLGAFVTSRGNVGTGLTDYQRTTFWNGWKSGSIKPGDLIEVECMELTKEGKFRHPRFVRFRWDKSEADG